MASKKPLLVLIHGFRGTREGLALIAAQLEKDFTCVVPDLPGFGDGPTANRYDLEAYVEWLHGFITSQKEPPYLLGHSFGSIVTAAYAAQYPDTIKKLMLVNPIGAPALEGPRGALSKLAVAYYWIAKHLPASAGKLWLSSTPSVMVMSSVMAKTKDKQLRRFIHDQHLQYFSRFHSADSVYQGFITSVSHSVRDVADQIKVPTLLIAGEQDDITPLGKQRELLEKFSDAKLVIIKNVGHLTHYETPDQVAVAVQSFINEA
jgi:pimeloyl-ACP methyl ester carboxylesterase